MYTLSSESIPVAAQFIRRESAIVRLMGLRVRILPVHGYLSPRSVAYCEVEFSASGRQVVQTGVLPSVMCLSVVVKPWPSWVCLRMEKYYLLLFI